jgi:FkbM family methyltransferase
MSYIQSNSYRDKVIEVRNGFKIFLSNHEQDLITVMVVFCKKVYGSISKDCVVVDIGANVGVFSLYAAYMGAKKVYAFEPNQEAYDCLQKNVRENNLEDVIIPFKLAVAVNDNEIVKIPLASSPLNRTYSDKELKNNEELDGVSTISVEGILNQCSIHHVDLLKIDCEGAEYDILPAIQHFTLDRIDTIKMEYHQDSVEPIVSHLGKHNFKVTKYDPQESCLWLSK